MSYMFYECSSLKELNISIFNTDNLENKEGIFSSCPFFIKKKIKEFLFKVSFFIIIFIIDHLLDLIFDIK